MTQIMLATRNRPDIYVAIQPGLPLSSSGHRDVFRLWYASRHTSLFRGCEDQPSASCGIHERLATCRFVGSFAAVFGCTRDVSGVLDEVNVIVDEESTVFCHPGLRSQVLAVVFHESLSQRTARGLQVRRAVISSLRLHPGRIQSFR